MYAWQCLVGRQFRDREIPLIRERRYLLSYELARHDLGGGGGDGGERGDDQTDNDGGRRSRMLYHYILYKPFN
jgi:hypothetical protein